MPIVQVSSQNQKREVDFKSFDGLVTSTPIGGNVHQVYPVEPTTVVIQGNNSSVTQLDQRITNLENNTDDQTLYDAFGNPVITDI